MHSPALQPSGPGGCFAVDRSEAGRSAGLWRRGLGLHGRLTGRVVRAAWPEPGGAHVFDPGCTRAVLSTYACTAISGSFRQ